MSGTARIKYVSRFAKPLSHEEISEIARVSEEKNAKLDITGMLMSTGGLFLQVLEGPAESVDELCHTIRSDSRHKAVLLLSEETGVSHRTFDKWSMGKVDLEDEADARLEPLRQLLSIVTSQRKALDELTSVLERLAWNELMRSS